MNSTAFTNFTTSSMAIDHVPPDASLEFKIAKITIYVAIFVLTIIGNVLVILVICYDKRMRGSSHILILNLAVCDLITPTISIPFDLTYEEMSYAWPFGSVMCKILWPGQTYTTTCSALFLTAICIDRYRALVYPFKVRWAGKFCLMVFSMYTFAVAMVVPYLLVLHFDEGAGKRADCAEKWPNPQKTFRQAYTIVLFLSQYALPLMIMITLYSITLRSLFNNSKQLLSDVSIIKTRDQNKSCGSQSPRNHLSLQEVRKEQHLKVTKMFITVVIVFAISMFPNQVLWLWVDFGNLASNKYFPMISIICRIFTYSNSVLNPFIYGLYSKDFRSGYKKAGKKISKANKHHQALYHHFNRTDKRQFQSSDILQGTNDGETDLITGCNKHSYKRGTLVIKTELDTLEEGSKQAKDVRNCLQEQNPLNQNEMHSTGQPATENSSTSSIRIPLSTIENELGVEEESGKRAGLFVNEKDSIDDDVIMNISKCIESQTSNNCKSVTQGMIKKNVAEYLEKLTETKC